jgi:hypothetical protein
MGKWYVSVMLNRLMFVYFIQKKGFLDGDPDYLRNRLRRMQAQHGDDRFYSFYRHFLLRLFHEGLGQPGEAHSPDLDALVGKVPYLNGGIFAEHEVEQQYPDIQISDAAFENIFNFFDQYQWHLDDRPLRDDREINPDVLGYIFEKYINQKQMGAYYTKEDITGYIGRNTILPFLFDQARQDCAIAFEGDNSVWELLAADPDRYIYPAVRQGTELPLPPEIAAGLDDVSQRQLWNTPAPEEYSLPTEIWRETVARRQRYEEVWLRLAEGELRAINDLITYNLDIQQFAQDVVENSEGPELIRAFWKAIRRVSVLDPTCGSGAFLFAALNILEPLYEACLGRMEAFVAELGPDDHPQKYHDFKETLAQVGRHPNQTYYILKSIVVNNLYGVDIMPEAVEIAKLRLFLKLASQVESVAHVEPLPDIDFNIRAGNTLVGFTTKEEVLQAMKVASGGQGKLMFGEDQEALARIEEKAGFVDRLFSLYRKMQTQHEFQAGEAADFVATKAELRRRLSELEVELNRYLAAQYGVNPDRPDQYQKWLQSHQPFHWFVEFFGILKQGGFDVIIGNPPWKEYSAVRKVYTVRDYRTESAGNLYGLCAERSLKLRASNGLHSFIVQLPLVSSSRMTSVRKELTEGSSLLYLLPFDDRPGKLFNGLHNCRSTIYVSLGRNSDTSPDYHTTKYQRWYSDVRELLFQGIEFVTVSPEYSLHPDQFAKYAGSIERAVFEKVRVKSGNTIASFISPRPTSHFVFYQEATRYWVKATVGLPYYSKNGEVGAPAHGRYLYFGNEKHSKCAGAIMNSSLFYAYFVAYTDGFHLSNQVATAFPVDDALMKHPELAARSERLMEDLKEQSEQKTINTSSGDQITYAEFYAGKSKPIIDEIDRVLAQHYGFSDEELDFIINYDVKYRMGDELFDDGEDG